MAVQDIQRVEVHIGTINWRNLRYMDWLLFLLVLMLAAVGVAVIYSAKANELPTQNVLDLYHLKQMIFFAGGLALAIALLCTDYRFLIAIAPVFYLVIVGFLVAVHIKGMDAGGNVERWLRFGPFAFQPSEVSKLTVVYALAWYFGWAKQRIRKLFYFGLTFLIPAVPGILILLQPNLGTAAALGPIVLGMLFVAGCKKWHLFALLALAVPFAQVAYEHGLKPYQKERLTSFRITNPTKDQLRGPVWQPYQSRLAVGSGQMWGKGFMKGEQTQLNYLPEHHTDFIFSVLAEEHGFVGSIMVISLFCLLLLRGLVLAASCPNPPGALLGVGSVIILAFHVFINIGIAIGILPVTGTPLPFLSYGGSFYLTTMACIGTILSVNVRRGTFKG